MPAGERPARTSLQISLKCGSPLRGSEAAVHNELPRAVLRRVVTAAVVVFRQALLQVCCDPDVSLLGFRCASQQVYVVHTFPQSCRRRRPDFAKATSGTSLRKRMNPRRSQHIYTRTGLPAEALAKAGGGGGSRTPVPGSFRCGVYGNSPRSFASGALNQRDGARTPVPLRCRPMSPTGPASSGGKPGNFAPPTRPGRRADRGAA